MRQFIVRSLVTLSLSLMPVMAAPMVFHADLSGLEEAPPNASPGTGFTFVTFDPVAHTMRVEVAFSGLLGLVNVAHIHIGRPTGGVATTTPTFPGFPAGVSAGTYDQTFDLLLPGTYNPAFLNNPTNMGDTAIAEMTLLNGLLANNAYLNIHSLPNFGAGEIRGFLLETPEPSTFAVAGSALIGLLAIRRRRKSL